LAEVTDVIVVGAGIAGLVAANRVAELGCSVSVLERGEDRYPCNTRLTGGLFHVCYKDATSTPARLLGAMNAEVPSAAPELVKAISQNSGRFITWLRAQGVTMMKASNVEVFRWVLAPPRIMKKGYSERGRGGDVMLRTLESRLKSRGGRVIRGVRAQQLLVDDEGVGGVCAFSRGQLVRFEAKTTLLADGGFQANLEMLKRYISPDPQLLFQRGAATGCGDGIRMAQSVGASLRGMDAFYGHVLSRDVFGNPDLWPYPIMDRVVAAGIAVDSFAQRFTDEGMGGVSQANAIARLAGPCSAVAIFDDAIWNSAGREFLFPPNPHLHDRMGTIHSAPDLSALAKTAGLPGAELLKTVNTYNVALSQGGLQILSPPRSSERFLPMPITTPPFYAVPLCAGITYTMGGIAIDRWGRALDDSAVPIPNLFAAGCTAGGLEGGPGTGYVGGLIKSGVTGLLAAEGIGRQLTVHSKNPEEGWIHA